MPPEPSTRARNTLRCSPMTDVTLRPFTASDIDFAVKQTTREGWDSTADFFQTCLALDPNGSIIAEIDRRSVGMATTTHHRRTGWIGNVIVEPAHRSRGIGRTLMLAAIDRLEDRGIATIRLEADPPGIKLYRSLGFVDEGESLRFQRPAQAAHPLGYASKTTPTSTTHAAVRSIMSDDLDRIIERDSACFGDCRERLLRAIWEAALTTVFAQGEGDDIGYALVVAARTGVRIGPWIAADARMAATMLDQILRDPATVGRSIGLGVPALCTDVIALLQRAGFERTASSFRMVRGGTSEETRRRTESVYAIANGAMG